MKIDLPICKQLAGDAAVVHCSAAMSKVMPTAERATEPATTLMQLDQLKSSDQFRVAPRQVLGHLNHLIKLVTGLAEENIIDASAALANPHLKNVVDKFVYFVRAPAGKTTVFGGEALREVLKAGREQLAKNIFPENAKLLRLYHWLVPSELADEVKDFLQQVKAKADTLKSAVAGVKPKKLAKPTRSSSGVDPAVQAALDMFK